MVLSWQPAVRAQEARTYYYQLISGSDRALPLTGEAKAVGPKLRSQLEAKFRWKHYAEISRGKLTLATNKTSSIRLPEKREMQLQLVSSKTLEARLYRGGEVVRKTRENANADSLIMGGDQGKDESWFIVIRRDKPSTIDTAQAK
jgi:hypothetical protein